MREAGQRGCHGAGDVITHDRWFARSFERFLVFTSDGSVREATEPVWD